MPSPSCSRRKLRNWLYLRLQDLLSVGLLQCLKCLRLHSLSGCFRFSSSLLFLLLLHLLLGLLLRPLLSLCGSFLLFLFLFPSSLLLPLFFSHFLFCRFLLSALAQFLAPLLLFTQLLSLRLLLPPLKSFFHLFLFCGKHVLSFLLLCFSLGILLLFLSPHLLCFPRPLHLSRVSHLLSLQSPPVWRSSAILDIRSLRSSTPAFFRLASLVLRL
mmetsp:Transcript_1714/g.2991  ORF Transcript_1714/g.2991 Transcript_1714/m.2991 type:complete len:214 (+) Transcript_1714:462-1103(+)